MGENYVFKVTYTEKGKDPVEVEAEYYDIKDGILTFYQDIEEVGTYRRTIKVPIRSFAEDWWEEVEMLSEDKGSGEP